MFTNIRSICFTVTYQTERIKALPRHEVDVKYSGAFGMYKCIIGEILYLYISRMFRNPGQEKEQIIVKQLIPYFTKPKYLHIGIRICEPFSSTFFLKRGLFSCDMLYYAMRYDFGKFSCRHSNRLICSKKIHSIVITRPKYGCLNLQLCTTNDGCFRISSILYDLNVKDEGHKCEYATR